MENKRVLLKQAKNTAIYYAIVAAIAMVKILPRSFSLLCIRLLAYPGYLLSRKERRKIDSNLMIAFGGKYSSSERFSIGLANFKNIGQNLVDAVLAERLLTKDPDAYIKIDGIEIALQALNRKNGVILLTAHTGCFEMLPARFSMLGFPLVVLGTRAYDDRLNKLIVENRKIFNVSYIHRDDNLKTIISSLKAGKAFGVLCDLDTRVESRFINFFNTPAKTPMGPFKLGVRLSVPMIPVFAVRQKDGTQYVKIYPALVPQGSSDEEKLLFVMKKYNSILEEVISLDPAQWIWMHERWKSKP